MLAILLGLLARLVSLLCHELGLLRLCLKLLLLFECRLPRSIRLLTFLRSLLCRTETAVVEADA